MNRPHAGLAIVNVSDHATVSTIPRKGGIDLTHPENYLQIKNDGEKITLTMDPAMFAQLRNARGFEAEVVEIMPLHDLQRFLGVPNG